MQQVLLMKEGECKFNIPLKLRKSFQVNDTEDKLQEQNLGFAAMPEQFKSLSLENGKYFWGYANVSEIDMQGDLFPIETLEEIAPGLTKAPYNKIFLNHDYSDIASGTIVATATDGRGIIILAKLNEDHQRAWEIWQSILNGSLDGLSMGGSFLEVESYYDEANDLTVTVAKKATGTEVSLTSIPVNGGSMLMGAFQKAQKKFTEKFGDPKVFMKGAKLEEVEKFKYNKSQDNNMVEKKEMSDEQKKAYDKAISEGKSKKEAYDMVMKEQEDEAEKNVNQDLVGKKKASDKKEIKKSVEGEEESETEEKEEPAEESETEEAESEEEETPEEPEKETEEEKAEETEKEESVDYQKAFEEMKAKNEELTKELSEYKKAVPKKEEKESEEPIRKSQKATEEAVPNPSNSTQKADKTPFLSWLKN